MSRSATGPLPEPAEIVVEKLQALAVKYEVEFQGDVTQGYASGKGFYVKYLIHGKDITLTVTKKPLLIPWTLVEKTLTGLFK